jgi:hypothetical protein
LKSDAGNSKGHKIIIRHIETRADHIRLPESLNQRFSAGCLAIPAA